MSTAAPLPEPVSVRNVPLPAPEQLPDDPETLKRMILELLATLHQERQDKDALRQRLDLLLRRLYGARTERFNPEQALLFADAAEEPAAAEVGAAESESSSSPRPRRCKPHGRRQIPANLPRRPVHHELNDAERTCPCGQVRIDIGTDVSEQLDWQPASFFVWQHLTHKYACPRCAGKMAASTPTTPPAATVSEPTTTTTPPAATVSEPATTTTPPAATVSEPATTTTPPAATVSEPTTTTTPPAATVSEPTTTTTPGETGVPSESAATTGPAVVSATKPPMPIDKGLPGAGLLAHVIVSKYLDHLPLYRLERIFERQGMPIPRSTSCDWMAACAELLRPLYQQMVAVVLQSLWLHTDDTAVKNQGHAPGTTATARFWAYLGDVTHPYNVFDFTLNRRRDGPKAFLAHYRGYLHADAFSGYDALYLPSPRPGVAPIVEVACNAHARRKFYEARGSDAVRSHQALAYYAQLYEIEHQAKNCTDAQRQQMRQDLAVPILDRFHTWLKEQRAQVLPKSPMAEAIGYALNNGNALRRYTEAGYLSIDNNQAEREMKRIAIGRKNWLFVGSDKGGETAAVLFSFTSTCHRLGINSWTYLQDVLTRLPTMPAERLVELLPDRWQAAHPTGATSGSPQSNP